MLAPSFTLVVLELADQTSSASTFVTNLHLLDTLNETFTSSKKKIEKKEVNYTKSLLTGDKKFSYPCYLIMKIWQCYNRARHLMLVHTLAKVSELPVTKNVPFALYAQHRI